VLAIALSMMFIPALLRPKAPNPIKYTAYESGMPPIGEAQARYTIRYYVIAMLFVVFDIEAVFFYPWAVAFNSLGWYGLLEIILFIVLLLVAYIYAWRKGALDWVSS
jgi:NADH-quinone oxidoreductase subunit A